jgi:hypothetical protein
MHHGKVCYVRGEGGATVHFLDRRTLLMADKEEMVVRYLKSAPTTFLHARPFADALLEADQHDAVAWSNYNTPLLGVLPLPLLAGVKSATVSVDIGEQIVLQMRVQCTDEASAAKLVGPIRAILGMFRGQLGMGVTMSSLRRLTKFAPGLTKEEFPILPTKLLKEGEKALRRARVRGEGNTVPVVLRLALDGPTLRSELTRLSTVMGMKTKKAAKPTPQPSAKDAPRYSSPITSPRDGGPPVTAAAPVKGAPAFPPPTVTGPLPPLPAPSVPSAPSTAGLYQSGAPGRPPGSFPPTASAMVPPPGLILPAGLSRPAGMKLTVANLKKEPALLFTKGANGKLTFVQRVPPGKAVDLDAAPDQGWVAVFTEAPAGEAFTTGKADAVWLLR